MAAQKEKKPKGGVHAEVQPWSSWGELQGPHKFCTANTPTPSTQMPLSNAQHCDVTLNIALSYFVVFFIINRIIKLANKQSHVKLDASISLSSKNQSRRITHRLDHMKSAIGLINVLIGDMSVMRKIKQNNTKSATITQECKMPMCSTNGWPAIPWFLEIRSVTLKYLGF